MSKYDAEMHDGNNIDRGGEILPGAPKGTPVCVVLGPGKGRYGPEQDFTHAFVEGWKDGGDTATVRINEIFSQAKRDVAREKLRPFATAKGSRYVVKANAPTTPTPASYYRERAERSYASGARAPIDTSTGLDGSSSRLGSAAEEHYG